MILYRIEESLCYRDFDKGHGECQNYNIGPFIVNTVELNPEENPTEDLFTDEKKAELEALNRTFNKLEKIKKALAKGSEKDPSSITEDGRCPFCNTPVPSIVGLDLISRKNICYCYSCGGKFTQKEEK